MNKITTMMTSVTPYNETHFDDAFNAYYLNPPSLEQAARLFLDRPYLFEALGEGPMGIYSQEPLYRNDQFDCVTYIDTVLALAQSKDFAHFKKNILLLRYQDGVVDYTHRTDWFTDLEWLPNARKLGWIQDVTSTIVNNQQQAIAEIAKTIIDKPNWYYARDLLDLHLFSTISEENAATRLAELQAKSSAFQSHPSTLSYIPKAALTDPFIINQLPTSSIIALVRPNWAIRDNFKNRQRGYGSNLNVSHMGILLKTFEGLTLFHASSIQHKVVKISLTEYLTSVSDEVKGVHIERICS